VLEDLFADPNIPNETKIRGIKLLRSCLGVNAVHFEQRVATSKVLGILEKSIINQNENQDYKTVLRECFVEWAARYDECTD